jgi:hypothetical protein
VLIAAPKSNGDVRAAFFFLSCFIFFFLFLFFFLYRKLAGWLAGSVGTHPNFGNLRYAMRKKGMEETKAYFP